MQSTATEQQKTNWVGNERGICLVCSQKLTYSHRNLIITRNSPSCLVLMPTTNRRAALNSASSLFAEASWSVAVKGLSGSAWRASSKRTTPLLFQREARRRARRISFRFSMASHPSLTYSNKSGEHAWQSEKGRHRVDLMGTLLSLLLTVEQKKKEHPVTISYVHVTHSLLHNTRGEGYVVLVAQRRSGGGKGFCVHANVRNMIIRPSTIGLQPWS